MESHEQDWTLGSSIFALIFFKSLRDEKTSSGTIKARRRRWPDLNSRAIIGGGSTPSRINVIEFVEIVSTGNGTDFGDLSATVANLGAVNNKQRGVFGGGYGGSGAGTHYGLYYNCF